MRYRPLGNTGLTVSEIGFGAWGIGGSERGAAAYGRADRAESLSALARALDVGVNFYDTSDFYGLGQSEELIGEAFAHARDRVVIASKVGMVDAAGRQDFSTRHIRRALEATLRRLGTDYVDLYQLHSPAVDVLLKDPEPLHELERLQVEGLIRAAGVSLRSPEDGPALLRELDVACLQVNFSLVDQRARACGLLDACASRRVGVIARTPLCFGFLTGHFRADSRFDVSDHRHRWGAGQIAKWTDANSVFENAFAAASAQTAAQRALRFCISEPGISTAIPGMMTVGHVNENAAASDLGALTTFERKRIYDIYAGHVFFEVPSKSAGV